MGLVGSWRYGRNHPATDSPSPSSATPDASAGELLDIDCVGESVHRRKLLARDAWRSHHGVAWMAGMQLFHRALHRRTPFAVGSVFTRQSKLADSDSTADYGTGLEYHLQEDSKPAVHHSFTCPRGPGKYDGLGFSKFVRSSTMTGRPGASARMLLYTHAKGHYHAHPSLDSPGCEMAQPG